MQWDVHRRNDLGDLSQDRLQGCVWMVPGEEKMLDFEPAWVWEAQHLRGCCV